MQDSPDDPTKAPEFNRVVDHFLNTRVEPKAKPAKPTKRKTRPANKARVRQGKSK